MRFAILASALMLASAACNTPPKPVVLSDSWPAKVGEYHETTKKWTRRGKLIGNYADSYENIVEVKATFQSMEWRAAYVNYMTKQQLLPSEKQIALANEQKKLATDFHEVALLIRTYHSRDNDFQKNKRSMWRIALVDAKGQEVEPVEVKSDRRKRTVINALYPNLDEFDEVYLARFPRAGIDLFADGANKFSLKVASARGGVELHWLAKK